MGHTENFDEHCSVQVMHAYFALLVFRAHVLHQALSNVACIGDIFGMTVVMLDGHNLHLSFGC